MRLDRLYRAAGLIAFALLLAGIGYRGLAATAESTTGRQSEAPRTAKPLGTKQRPFAVPVVKGPDARQRMAFPALGSPPEPLPRGLRRIMRFHPTYGMNWDLAQRLSKVGGRPVWLVPGRQYLCELWLPPEEALRQVCAMTSRVAVHGLGLALIVPGWNRDAGAARREIAGIAPRNASRVTIRTGGHISRRPVRPDGVFVIHDHLGDPPDDVTFTGT